MNGVTVGTQSKSSTTPASSGGDSLQDPLGSSARQSTPVQTATPAVTGPATGGSGTPQPDAPKTVPKPNFKKAVIPKAEAAQNLHEARASGDNTLVSSWIDYVVRLVKPPAGPVTATYVSSFDTARGGFSASRTLPDVPDLVVHGHYQRDLAKPKEAKVNSAQVKWSDDEGGSAPPGPTKLAKGKEPEILGSDHDKVALAAWEQNPQRHEMRAEAVGKKKAKEKEEPLDLDWMFGPNAKD